MIKAVYFDADGTLVSFATHTIPPDAVAALEMLRKRGLHRVLCTGRNATTARDLIASGLFDALILLNGQYCELSGRVVYSRPIDSHDLNVAVEGALSGRWTLGFVSVNDNFMNRDDPFLRSSEARGGMPPTRFDDPRRALGMDIYQMHYYGPPGGERELLDETKGLTASRWACDFADVYPAGGGKALAMARLNACLGLTARESMAFGDGENDITTLEAAGIGVAMGNASAAVRAHADYVTSTVDEGGIAKALEHFRDLL